MVKRHNLKKMSQMVSKMGLNWEVDLAIIVSLPQVKRRLVMVKTRKAPNNQMVMGRNAVDTIKC